ncbi:MAG: alpha-L-fucosidase [Ferruginibacter sp.]
MKKFYLNLLSVFLYSLILSNSSIAQTTSLKTKESLQEWQNDKFGLFLHWGLYSQAAGLWKGKPYRGNEHFMIYEKASLKEYGALANDFNPTKFNAEQWVLYAKNAGMKYIVITTKHHDGFAMWNSATNDYNIIKRSPFKRDPLKELADACKKHGMKLGFYYSLGRDWEDPDVPTNWPTKGGRSNLADYPNEDIKVLSKYIERKVKPQIKELLTQYGPIEVIWFDTPELLTKEMSTDLLHLIKNLQPNCIVNSRIGNGLGDYKVSEQEITAKTILTPWEACITMSKGWGYNRFDTAWKSAELLVRQLVEIVSKGGNLLLNVGPKGTGEFPPEAVDRLKAIGGWMKINKEAIYGTNPWEISNELVSDKTLSHAVVHDALGDVTSKIILPDIYFTAKENTVYVIARSWKDAKLPIKSLANNKHSIKSVNLLGCKCKLKWKADEYQLTIKMPKENKLPKAVPVYVFKVVLWN